MRFVVPDYYSQGHACRLRPPKDAFNVLLPNDSGTRAHFGTHPKSKSSDVGSRWGSGLKSTSLIGALLIASHVSHPGPNWARSPR